MAVIALDGAAYRVVPVRPFASTIVLRAVGPNPVIISAGPARHVAGAAAVLRYSSAGP